MSRPPLLLECVTCGRQVVPGAEVTWRCPDATDDDRHHVLHRVAPLAPFRPFDDPNPIVAADDRLLWARIAEAAGLDRPARTALVRDLDDRLRALGEPGFTVTPFARSTVLSDALGCSTDGGVWVKDETVDVAGSHKARHLVGILLVLLALERAGRAAWGGDRPPLAIASCGNAALAGATLAAAVEWPIEVFVPVGADPAVLAQLAHLDARVVACPRTPDGPPGDPCLHAFRDAVARGAVPFSVQGPENALCLDVARTIGWEMTEVLGARLDRVVVQVGGGALATSLGHAFAEAGVHPRLDAVQSEGCHPLALAWERAGDAHLSQAAARWSEWMQPWADEPRSVASGILDDETYDWLGVVRAMRASGGRPVVVSEALLHEANDLATEAGFDADHTATAGLAGVLAVRADLDPDETVAVLVTGRRRR